jgi:glutamine synthetase
MSIPPTDPTAAERDRARELRRVVRECRAAKIQLVRFLYCGNDGVVRGKAAHTRFLPAFLQSGIGLTVAMQSFNMLDQLVAEGSFGPVGEVRLVPDPASFAVLPYAPGTARMLCDMTTLDGQPWEACPRAFLRRMIARAAAQGFVFKAAMENEFTLARRENGRYVPLDHSPCFSTIGMDGAGPVMSEIIEALGAQGVHPEQYYAELGPGQQELPVRYADVLRAADNQITVRETARAVAWRHGLYASFAPKPFADEAGNGAHVHFSLWRADSTENVFHDPRDAHGISEIARAFIGGVLAHLPALVALTAPTVNSYRRLQPRFWCSAYTAWGPDNKEAAIRLPTPYRSARMESTNFELKPSDPSANPFLALGGVLAAGLDGIAAKRDPGEPTLVDPDTLSDAERARRGIRRLPRSLGEALDELERDAVLRGALGETLAKEYLIVKRSEVRAFDGKDAAFEIDQHFYKF